MAYGTYILIEFMDEDDNLYSIAVKRDGHTATPIERTADSAALKIEFGDGAATDYPGVMGSRATFRFHQEYHNNEFPSLYTTDKRKYKVEITKNAEMYWVGWVKTENYRTSMTYRPVIEVTATDGLADLKEMDFVDYASATSGRKTRHWIIKEMLALTDLDLNFNVSTQMTEANVTGNPFTGLNVNVAVYAEKTCREALEDSLLTHTLIQRDGEWTIRNWHSHTKDSIYVYNYDVNGTEQSKGAVANAAKVVDYDTSYFTGSPSNEFIAALRKVWVKSEYDLITPNLVKNSDLESGWNNWAVGGGLTEYELMEDKNGERFMRLDNANEYDSGARPYMQQEITLKALAVSLLTIKHALFPESAPPDTACEFIQLMYVDNGTIYYGYLEVYNVGGDPSYTIKFDTTSSWIPLRFALNVSTVEPEFVDPTDNTSFSTFEVPMYIGDLTDEEVTLYLRLGSPSAIAGTNHGVRADYKDVSLVEMEQDDPAFTDDTRSIKEVDYAYTYKQDSGNYFKKKEVTVIAGNHPNANSCFTTKHILSYSADAADVANQFSMPGTTELWTWEQYISEMYLSLFKRPLNTIIGKVKGVTPWDIVVDSVDLVRYVFASVSFDAVTGMCDGRLMEAVGYQPPLEYDEDKARVTGDDVRVTPVDLRYKEDE